MFYARSLPRCSESGCDRPATQQILGPRNEDYGVVCDRHVKRKLARLEETHARPAARAGA